MNRSVLAQVLEQREETAQKGDNGRVLVIGGSDRYRNTPAIAGLAAVRAGCDLVEVAAPQPSADATGTHSLHVTTTSLDGPRFDESMVNTVADRAAAADSAVIGPGLGREPETLVAIHEVLDMVGIPAVIDADALRSLGESITPHPEWVLTPHTTEFTELTSTAVPDGAQERQDAVQEAANAFGCTVLLKGATDIVSDGDRVLTSDTGHPAMAKGGTGDILAGVTAAFLARGHPAVKSAHTAAVVNGMSGDAAVDQYGTGFVLEEFLACLPDVIEELRSEDL